MITVEEMENDFFEDEIPIAVAQAYYDKYKTLPENPTRLEVLNYHKVRMILENSYIKSNAFNSADGRKHLPIYTELPNIKQPSENARIIAEHFKKMENKYSDDEKSKTQSQMKREKESKNMRPLEVIAEQLELLAKRAGDMDLLSYITKNEEQLHLDKFSSFYNRKIAQKAIKRTMLCGRLVGKDGKYLVGDERRIFLCSKFNENTNLGFRGGDVRLYYECNKNIGLELDLLGDRLLKDSKTKGVMLIFKNKVSPQVPGFHGVPCKNPLQNNVEVLDSADNPENNQDHFDEHDEQKYLNFSDGQNNDDSSNDSDDSDDPQTPNDHVLPADEDAFFQEDFDYLNDVQYSDQEALPDNLEDQVNPRNNNHVSDAKYHSFFQRQSLEVGSNKKERILARTLEISNRRLMSTIVPVNQNSIDIKSSIFMEPLVDKNSMKQSILNKTHAIQMQRIGQNIPTFRHAAVQIPERIPMQISASNSFGNVLPRQHEMQPPKQIQQQPVQQSQERGRVKQLLEQIRQQRQQQLQQTQQRQTQVIQQARKSDAAGRQQQTNQQAHKVMQPTRTVAQQQRNQVARRQASSQPPVRQPVRQQTRSQPPPAVVVRAVSSTRR